jgi:phosphoglycerate dehydrogenase-like enzyme
MIVYVRCILSIMDSGSPPLGIQNVARDSKQTRPSVVCAISSAERRLFLTEAAQALRDLPADITWLAVDDAASAIHALQTINPDVLVTSWSTPALPTEWISSSTCAVRYVCHLNGSVRWLVPRTFLERGGTLTNWGGLPCGAVAEHALLLALAALRNLRGWEEVLRKPHLANNHIERLHTRTLFGRNVSVHGFGQVACALIALLKPFGVVLHAFSAGVPTGLMREKGATPAKSLAALAAHAEVFFECEALTPATMGSVSASILAALPTGAVFVNVARGLLVDEAALLREASAGRIRVALDVVATEPLTADSPFCRVSDAVLSPHIAGPTFDQYAACGEHATRNLAAYLDGAPLDGRMSLEEYDRST